jgi:hypothetical protein
MAAFQSTVYGSEVDAILALDGRGARPMPLANGTPFRPGIDALAGRKARDLFRDARSPEAALSGLYLYFCAYDESHSLSQDILSPEGSFWHGIMHRQEPDPGNSGYWFRRVGQHPIFAELRDAAAAILDERAAKFDGTKFRVKSTWDPFAFIDFCEHARRKPGSNDEETAMAIQLAEWQLLFDYCARAQQR